VNTSVNDNRLRVGLILPEKKIPAWFRYVLEMILRSTDVDFGLILLVGNENRETANRPFVYLLFDWVDRILFSRGCDPLVRKSLPEALKSVPIKNCILPQDGTLSNFNHDQKDLAQEKIDLYLAVGVNIQSSALIDSCRLGIMSIVFGSYGEASRKMPGFIEVFEKQGLTTTTLRMNRSNQPGIDCIDESTWFTYPFSPARHRSYYYWASAAMLPRAIRKLQELRGQKTVLRESNSKPLIDQDPKEGKYSSSLWIFSCYLKLIARGLLEVGKRVFNHESWVLLYGPDHSRTPDIASFTALTPPKGKFWADPILVEKEMKQYIFFEEYENRKHKGCIAVISKNSGGLWTPPVTVLEKDCHLSYPFIFPREAQYYMVPESNEKGRIDLYECALFPLHWEFHHTMIDNILARDTTLFFYDGLWWLFTAVAACRAQGANVELMIYYCPDFLTSQWSPHPKNPVCSDIRRSRPAGKIFQKNGKLFRPSQDCSRGYGYGIDLNEIEELSTTGYREKTIQYLRPRDNSNLIGIHTLSKDGKFMVVDGLVRRSVFDQRSPNTFS
jgi:hypothetical protein